MVLLVRQGWRAWCPPCAFREPVPNSRPLSDKDVQPPSKNLRLLADTNDIAAMTMEDGPPGPSRLAGMVPAGCLQPAGWKPAALVGQQCPTSVEEPAAFGGHECHCGYDDVGWSSWSVKAGGHGARRVPSASRFRTRGPCRTTMSNLRRRTCGFWRTRMPLRL